MLWVKFLAILPLREFGHRYGFRLWRLNPNEADHYRVMLTAILGSLDDIDDAVGSMYERQLSLRFEILRWLVVLFHVSLLSKLNHSKGLAESAFYPGMQYIIGSWYRNDELAKRSCIFHASGAIATMCSGYLMAAVYNLDGRGGLAGWKWSVSCLLVTTRCRLMY